ncbi:MAG TPA: aspartate--tRNA ligase [Gemmatimonadaceae bacterium]|jgi:aspartyl-tRNA synthetase|nr:aspartate--tRNA ligase [Gemmatimonadaceae bacterium]
MQLLNLTPLDAFLDPYRAALTSTPLSSRFATAKRSHLAGELRASHAGTKVKLGGWVHRIRNLGGIVFLDLRDRAGLVQVSFDPKWTPQDVIERAGKLGLETVVLVEGEVAARPTEMRNPEMETGEVEVRAGDFRIVGPADTPAIPVARGRGEKLPAEELRLKHRNLDLRRSDLQKNLILRHTLQQTTRRFLDERGYLEIETPILSKPAPSGARDYVVPSRVHPGDFYALPQSPQVYKQLLMISGFDRYFQIARCFRDEDLRADRQPEFTQIDIEASFIEPQDIFSLSEGLLAALWKDIGVEIPPTFEHLAYADAMERFGIDRPDTRYGLELFDASDAFRGSEFGVTNAALAAGGRVRGLKIPGGAALSRKQLDEIEAIAKLAGAGGLIRLKRGAAGLEGPAAKFVSESGAQRLGVAEGELCLLVAGPEHVTNPALDRVRQDVAQRLSIVPESTRSFLWVTDFPLFTREQDGTLSSVHHPFTSPHPDDLHLLDSAPEKVRALAYDVVLNGLELGGGSIRINDPSLQRKVLALLGISGEDAQARFGFLLNALSAGAPPHGGIAFGFDRLAMVLAGATSLRDVIAFPKTTAASALFEDAPSAIPPEDLRALHLQKMTS